MSTQELPRRCLNTSLMCIVHYRQLPRRCLNTSLMCNVHSGSFHVLAQTLLSCAMSTQAACMLLPKQFSHVQCPLRQLACRCPNTSLMCNFHSGSFHTHTHKKYNFLKFNWITGSPPKFDTLLASWYPTYKQSFIISHSSCAEQYGDMSLERLTHTHTTAGVQLHVVGHTSIIFLSDIRIHNIIVSILCIFIQIGITLIGNPNT